jgi:hypothetical protein
LIDQQRNAQSHAKPRQITIKLLQLKQTKQDPQQGVSFTRFQGSKFRQGSSKGPCKNFLKVAARFHQGSSGGAVS